MGSHYTSNGHVLDADRVGPLTPVPAHERADRDRQRSRLRRDGYLYLPGHLDPDLVREFRAYYFAAMAGTGLLAPGSEAELGVAGDGPVDQAAVRARLFGEIVPGARYRELATHPTIRDWFAWFLGADVHLHRRKLLRHQRPGPAGIGAATQAHYDLVYLREGSDRVLTMWIPLGDCPTRMGALTYLERSHHWTMRDERSDGAKRPPRWMTADLPALADEHDQRWLLTDFAAGDVVVHTAYLVHAGTDNVDPDGRIRLSTDIRYQRASDPIDRRWQHDWTPDDGL